MAVHMISYDLRAPGQKYDDLTIVLEGFEGSLHAMQSTWVIETRDTAEQVCAKLEAVLDDDDEVLVMRVGRSAAWSSAVDDEATDRLMDALPRA